MFKTVSTSSISTWANRQGSTTLSKAPLTADPCWRLVTSPSMTLHQRSSLEPTRLWSVLLPRRPPRRSRCAVHHWNTSHPIFRPGLLRRLTTPTQFPHFLKGNIPMRKTPLTTISMLAVSVLLLSGCSGDSSAEADAAGGDWPEAITLSLVPSTEGEDLAEALDPLTSYLSDNLGIDVEGVVANDYAATVEALGADQADVVITDAGSLYNAVEQHDAELILRDVRFGAPSYAAVGYTNNPDTYCDDEPVMATYDAAGTEMAYCNGLETAGDVATGDGPVGTEALENIDAGTEIALQAATSPAGYQYPVVAMQDAGIDVDNDITQVPVEGNNKIGRASWR